MIQGYRIKPVCTFIAASLLLAGCASSNLYQPPVEDISNGRTGNSQVAPAGSVVPAAPSPGVTVSPVEEMQVYEVPDTAQMSSGNYSMPQSSTPTQSTVQQSSQNAAVVALLDQASSSTGSGNLQQAQQQLERAQRIAPRDPQVYYQLADVYRRLGQFMQAEQVALKGINAAQGQSAQQRRLWNLIALIRSDSGDSAGAKEAQQQAARY